MDLFVILTIFGIFNELLFPQNINEAHFASNAKRHFFKQFA